MLHSRVTRRTLLERTALATTALVAAPFVRSANAAGKLSIGFWDHWVPGANKASETLCKEWGEKNKVEISIDYITSQGNKNLLTIAAESQARSGHDIFAFPSWLPSDHANRLEPVDDIMAELIKLNGKVDPTVEYLAHNSGRWVAVPACVGSQIKGPCSRIDLMKQHAGIDVLAMYPAGSAPKADGWTLGRHAQGGRGVPQGRQSVRHRSRPDRRQRRHRRRDLPVVRRPPGRRQGQHHGQDRFGAPGARVLQEARAIPAAGCAGLGQRVEQQVPDRRQGRR